MLTSSSAMTASPMVTHPMLDKILRTTGTVSVTVELQRIHLLTVKILKKSHATATAKITATAMVTATATVTRALTVTSCLEVTSRTVLTGIPRTTGITTLTTTPSGRSLGPVLDLRDLSYTDHMIGEIRAPAPTGITGRITRTLPPLQVPFQGQVTQLPLQGQGHAKGFQDFSSE